jgi:hypothetical protein
MDAKSPSIDTLKKDLDYLEKHAGRLKKELDAALKNGDKNAGDLSQELKRVNGLIASIDAEAKKQVLAKSMKAAAEQANRTRERMEKLVQVGNRIAVAGAAMLAPFGIAINKYLESQKAIEAGGGKMDENARRMVELSQRWAASQERVGRVATEIILPYLEKALNLVDKIATFAEQHPDAVKAAFSIGASMVVIGGALSTVGTIVSTLATIKGLFAGAGLVSGATSAAGGAGMLAGLTPVLMAVMSNPLTWAVAALVLIKPIMNWLLGTNQTWADIANTGKQALILIGYGIDKLLRGMSGFFQSIGNVFNNGLLKLGEWIFNGIKSLISLIPGKASGGPIGKGLFMGGERGREFVLNNRTTRAAESALGGSLTQGRLLQALANGGGKNISYNDHRRIDSRLSASDRRVIVSYTMNALAGAL